MKVADVLEKRKEEILDRWLCQLSKELVVVNGMADSAIRNSIPELLEAMANALRTDKHKKVVFHSRHHGRQRSKFKGYTLVDIVREYHLLRKTIFEVLDDQDGIESEERDTIIYVIDQAIEQAADTFYRISQDVLIQGKRLAEQKADQLKLLDKNREEFILSLSHDLNNPLNNIQTGINLLEQDLELHEIESIIQIIRSSVKRATHLLDDLLATGTVGANESLPVRRKRGNLTKDLKEECIVFEMIYQRKIDFPESEDNLVTRLDFNLIRRAFNNLLNNAIKYSPSGTEIGVSCTANDDTIAIKVSNDGKLSSEELDRIFNRYYQSDDDKSGWGIGLSFVKQVAEAHGGRITADSTGGMVTFTMFLPKAPSAGK